MPYDKPFEHRPDSGSLFLNDKAGNDARPDFKGEGIFHGVPSWLSIWKKKTKAGDTWLSIQITKKDPLSQKVSGAGYKSGHNFEQEDDLPF